MSQTCHSRRKVRFHSASLKARKSKLVHEAHDELRVLEHMVDADVLHGVIRSVDVGAAVVVVRFEDEGGWVSVASSRRVVGAGIATGGLNVANVAVLIARG